MTSFNFLKGLDECYYFSILTRLDFFKKKKVDFSVLLNFTIFDSDVVPCIILDIFVSFFLSILTWR